MNEPMFKIFWLFNGVLEEACPFTYSEQDAIDWVKEEGDRDTEYYLVRVITTSKYWEEE